MFIFVSLVCSLAITEVLGVHAKACCWNNAPVSNAVAASEPDVLEAAFDENFTLKPPTRAPANDDPLDLESAFDVAFEDCEGPREEDATSDSTIQVDPSDSDGSHESVPGIAPDADASDHVTDDSEDDADDVRNDRRHVRELRRTGVFAREGKNILVGGRVIGTVTAWSGGVSCACKLHPWPLNWIHV